MATAYDLWLSDHPDNHAPVCTVCGLSAPYLTDDGECPDCDHAAHAEAERTELAAARAAADRAALLARDARVSRRKSRVRRSRLESLRRVLVAKGGAK